MAKLPPILAKKGLKSGPPILAFVISLFFFAIFFALWCFPLLFQRVEGFGREKKPFFLVLSCASLPKKTRIGVSGK